MDGRDDGREDGSLGDLALPVLKGGLGPGWKCSWSKLLLFLLVSLQETVAFILALGTPEG